MAANTSISLVDLDFQNIKNSLKNFLKGKTQFKDYDFEGSDINLMLELLAVNGYRTGFYQNMILNESFLDSAVLRNSVLSRSKELNYTPISAKSARARVRISFDASGENAPYTIAKGSQLTALVKNDSYTFTIPDLLIVASSNTSYTFETDIYQGFYVSDTYTYESGTTNKFFKISNPDVDLDSLTVTVYEDGNQIGDSYIRSTTLLDLTDKSKVFFVQPTGVGHFDVLFGDGNLGRKPKGDSTIVLNYRVTSGSLANGAREFVIDFDPTGNDELTSSVEVRTLRNAMDGAEEESIESIKYNAPRHFQVQERAVTATDYKSILKAQFPEIKAINAFGGEELSPPRYGRAYISVDIADVGGLPDSKKEQYIKFLSNRTTFGITPEFIEPSYTYVKVKSKVRYNINVTAHSDETIRSLVKDAIVGFRNENLGDFDVIFRASRLGEEIDNADPSIVSTINDFTIYKKTNPVLATTQDLRLDFGVELRSDLRIERPRKHSADNISAVSSSPFYYKSELCTLDDDGTGILQIMKVVGANHEWLADTGTVNYETGEIRINNFRIDSYVGGFLNIFVRPDDPDIVAEKNNIITIDINDVEINPQGIRA